MDTWEECLGKDHFECFQMTIPCSVRSGWAWVLRIRELSGRTLSEETLPCRVSILHKWKRAICSTEGKKKKKKTLLTGHMISYTPWSQVKQLKHSLMGKHLDDGIKNRMSTNYEEQYSRLSSNLHTCIRVHLATPPHTHTSSQPSFFSENTQDANKVRKSHRERTWM